MFGIDSSELMVIALVALLVIGPKDLPRAMRWLGGWIGKAKAMSRHVRSGFDTMMRESELEEMQKAWAAQNEAIMKASAIDPNALPGPFLANDDWMAPKDAPAAEQAAFETSPNAIPDAAVPDAAMAPAAPQKMRKPRKAKTVSPAPSE
ncbi:Sec-independent protein translocase protein TatB, partial [Sandarakinorhabdus sp.]|uniref:Sec-independent protein translocase protein TatB n=1 Tax=Sandarakinorhabdus sp. TaxID=1916663 RepID=UPI00286E5C56